MDADDGKSKRPMLSGLMTSYRCRELNIFDVRFTGCRAPTARQLGSGLLHLGGADSVYLVSTL